MRLSLILILFISSLTLYSTEQEPDLLIYRSDSILISKYPLEILIEQDSSIAKKIKNPNCISSACWRQYSATWKIENDSLFLIDLVDCCNFEKIRLEELFDADKIKDGRIFAFWFSDKIKNGFGKIKGWNEYTFQTYYEKQITIEIENGVVKRVEVKTTE